tara:strand:- start:296 stop:736 length:441 start_codon:yes stop_codon:yes gene_type:complete
MSYRSALSNPVANSGDVGRIVYGLNLSNNIPLTTGVQKGIDTITLGEGLWNISCACNLELSASATITNSQFFLAEQGFAALLDFTEAVAVTTTVSTNIGQTRSVIVSLSASTVLSFSTTTIFTVGTATIAKPSIVGNQYITATKIG